MLLDSDEFRYLDAFCNTVKHRRLMDTSLATSLGTATTRKSGLLYLSFTYKGGSYQSIWAAIWADEILEYRHRILQLVRDTVQSIIEFVEAV